MSKNRVYLKDILYRLDDKKEWDYSEIELYSSPISKKEVDFLTKRFCTLPMKLKKVFAIIDSNLLFYTLITESYLQVVMCNTDKIIGYTNITRNVSYSEYEENYPLPNCVINFLDKYYYTKPYFMDYVYESHRTALAKKSKRDMYHYSKSCKQHNTF